MTPEDEDLDDLERRELKEQAEWDAANPWFTLEHGSVDFSRVVRLPPPEPLPAHDHAFVPLSIRSRSRLVTWLWPRCKWINYDRGQKLARWLP